MFYKKYKKDFGGGTGDYTKNRVTNLFSNFKKIHVMSVGHIKNWCFKKGIDFYNHPYFVVAKEKTIILTNEDHKRLVREGIDIFMAVNNSTKNKPFVLVGDPTQDDVKSFWFKVQCTYGGDFLSVYLLKENLKANMMSLIGGTKHTKAIADALQRSGSLAT